MVEPRSFVTKYDAGLHLHQLLGLSSDQLRSDGGLWSWLSVRFFDQVCPPDAKGRRKPLHDNARYLARVGEHRFGLDKHLLFFPWKMVSLHREDAYPILSGPLRSDTSEQKEWIGSHYNLATPLVTLCRRLYWDEERGRFKPGARSKDRPGSLQRFSRVARQLEVTYDIFGMSSEQIAALLPRREFQPWLPPEWRGTRAAAAGE
ncbi:MAG: hypothetical protein R2724_22660 [Bryobacterales bacterium]